jgi:hypothetical protein
MLGSALDAEVVVASGALVFRVKQSTGFLGN